jgi:hypothetical protein
MIIFPKVMAGCIAGDLLARSPLFSQMQAAVGFGILYRTDHSRSAKLRAFKVFPTAFAFSLHSQKQQP